MDKAMKKYIKSVERRLNLPKDIKKRVMSDLESDILARQEAGMTVEAILAELGSPKKAAADLNFEAAVELRDKMVELKQKLEELE